MQLPEGESRRMQSHSEQQGGGTAADEVGWTTPPQICSSNIGQPASGS